MSEIFIEDESRATRFQRLHVYIPSDYAAYVEEMAHEWVKGALEAKENDKPLQPMWLRRNGESGSEFSAHIDYIMPRPGESLYLAGIDIADGDVQVYLPKEDGSGEPVVFSTEPYNLESLERAINLVETTVLPATS